MWRVKIEKTKVKYEIVAFRVPARYVEKPNQMINIVSDVSYKWLHNLVITYSVVPKYQKQEKY